MSVMSYTGATFVKKSSYLVARIVSFEVARVVEIASFDPTKKTRSVIFFQITQLLFRNTGFIIDVLEVFNKK